MIYKILADLTVIIHFLWILFLIAGAWIGRKYRLIKYFHIGGLGFALIIQIFGWYCPLTHLEVWLRAKHDPLLTYKGSFIVNYIEKLIYIELPEWLIFLLTLTIITINFLIYKKCRMK
ncbi:DUF2784 domain-containing protein [Thermodesulfovibrio sp. 1176]|uniref:DUF2784 domain-containing protein n=1 Tax=Thermodesulfovibrio sp. 1176 TaxID=3043424 RepID=UPI002482BBC3|nr:DUF2784 domain-containing protein [Thermodesulfovibrio sp. 1176]MDI1472467.1 DUF2784 domain-containing protein [Thermodesulfovibrio sp. 1176]